MLNRISFDGPELFVCERHCIYISTEMSIKHQMLKYIFHGIKFLAWAAYVLPCTKGAIEIKHTPTPELKKAGSAGSRLTEHFHIPRISRNSMWQIPHVARFYIYNWNMVQSQDITALFYSMELLQSLLKMFRKHYLFIAPTQLNSTQS